ncbi:hypothetical protein RJ640_027400 [Escallonia rubra]|uniref:Uncharacterized protein n=1 Tax=Escallonia rubra TaxID=112253 RepID=A0AA88UPH8_9ASTE|nr:hypothetical protein RJ640_001704 [Escallonia rubra]KAK2989626.1 hypothetical protein RJ640_027400 [Escallonia rubra]
MPKSCHQWLWHRQAVLLQMQLLRRFRLGLVSILESLKKEDERRKGEGTGGVLFHDPEEMKENNTSVVLPMEAWSRAFCTSFSDSESSALVASSSRRITGFLTMALAMAIRCFCPPDSSAPLSPTYYFQSIAAAVTSSMVASSFPNKIFSFTDVPNRACS